MSRTAIIVLGVFIALSLATAQEQPPKLTLRIELRPGPPIGETPEAAAEETAPQTVFDEGQPIDVAFIITNVGEAAYRYYERGRGSERDNEYRLTVKDAAGHPQDDPLELWGGMHYFGGPCMERSLAPGSSLAKHVDLNQWAMPLRPGAYSVCGAYRLNPPVRSAPVPFEVRSHRDMGAYIESLARELASGKLEDTRAQAARYLGFTGRTWTLPYLIDALYEPRQFGVRCETTNAFRCLRNTKACRDALLAALDQRGLAESVPYLLWHYEVPEERALPAVVKALDSPDSKVRAAAASTLGSYCKLGDAAFIPMTKALADPDPGVRAAAAGYLYPFRMMPAAVDAMLKASRDPDPRVRRAAANSMVNASWGVGAAAISARFREMLHETPDMAHEAIGTAWTKTLTSEALRDGLTATDPMVRLHTAVALFIRGDDTMRETMAVTLEQIGEADRFQAENYLSAAARERKLPLPTPLWDSRKRSPNADDLQQRIRQWTDWLRQKQ